MVSSQHRPTASTLRDAAAALGISRNTLRRRIASGQIHAEQVQRPQGFIWEVYLDGLTGSEQGSNGTVNLDGQRTVPEGSTLTPPQSGGAGAAIMQAEAMAAYNAQLLAPLVAVIERQSHQLVRQAEQIGALRTERDAARTELEAVKASHSPVAPDLTPVPAITTVDSRLDRWRALAPWALGVLAVLAAVALLAWPR